MYFSFCLFRSFGLVRYFFKSVGMSLGFLSFVMFVFRYLCRLFFLYLVSSLFLSCFIYLVV